MKDSKCGGLAPNLRVNPDARDPWFPGKGESAKTAQLICLKCPVRRECKSYRKRTNSKHGIWGGEIQKRD